MGFLYFIIALIAFGVLIIVHELGHFVMAKLNGVCVEEFSIGMGPKLFSKQGEETLYSLRLFPIGGYVKMLGEEDEEESERSFSAKSPLRRLSIIVAGVIMNVILAIFTFTIFLHAYGYTTTQITSVAEGSEGFDSGIKSGDEIVKVNGNTIYTFADIQGEVTKAAENDYNFTINRDGQKSNLTVINSEKSLGLGFTRIPTLTYFQSFKQSFNESASITYQTFDGLKKLITGRANVKTDIGGPVTVVKMETKAVSLGIMPLIYITGILSLSLAIMNSLPFPALDGGHFWLILFELVTGKKVPKKVQMIINGVGFIILIVFMIAITIKDIIFPISF
jgi:regulator of sigma E protease